MWNIERNVDEEKCILRSESLSKEETVLVKKALQTIEISSKVRGDRFWHKVAGFTEIKVYVECSLGLFIQIQHNL